MEVKDKKPKKPIMFYYAIVIVVLILLNTLLVPSIAERSIKEVRYCLLYTSPSPRDA